MVAEAALPLLFERYTQVSTTHARKYGGTGLGLAICKNLVRDYLTLSYFADQL
jgi:signal transduction histidine kinase